jgi:hypothetical protein
MHVALIQDDSIVAVGHYSKIFPNTSFPSTGPTAEFLTENNAKVVTNDFSYDATTQRIEDCTAYVEGDNVSTKRVVELTEWELSKKQESKWSRVRTTRNQLLKESDWTQLADSSCNTAAWASYRQALRDLPSSNTDPAALVWPTSPDASEEEISTPE